MKSVPTALQSLILSGVFMDVDCYTITTKSGPVLRYAAGDFNITDGTNTWDAHSVRIGDLGTSARGHLKVGLDIDTWSALFQPRSVDPITGASFPDAIGSTPWLAAAQAGALDDATLTVSRAYFATPMAYPPGGVTQPVGFLTIFEGPTTDIDVGSTSAVVNAESAAAYLMRDFPRNLFQTGCIHNLFDPGCTLTRASYAVSSSVGAGSTANTILSSAGAPAGSGTYALGSIKMTGGANAGFSRQVTAWTSGQFTLRRPFPYALATGDTFTAYPGCDKQAATCTAFGNLLNFGGERDIPAPETAV